MSMVDNAPYTIHIYCLSGSIGAYHGVVVAKNRVFDLWSLVWERNINLSIEVL